MYPCPVQHPSTPGSVSNKPVQTLDDAPHPPLCNSTFKRLNEFFSIVSGHSCFRGICSNVNVRHSCVGNRLPGESSSLVARVLFEYRFRTARSGKAGFLTSSLRLLMVCGSQSGWSDFQTACRSVSQWPVQPSPCLTYLSHQEEQKGENRSKFPLGVP